jgi:hypothetical protein
LPDFARVLSQPNACRPNSAEFKYTLVFGFGRAVEPRSFVVKDQKLIRPACCAGNAHLIRRSPDPVKRDGQKFVSLNATVRGNVGVARILWNNQALS